ncbi:ATP-binding cassette domain-containing protein [Kineococcus sp. NPDC059986]|uniref:ABC transporter ATP-binding protein n=1 Tax=Kineococcus sp. NPDC059986 TaxID=3155538 RepID=UPI00344B0074
MTGSALVLEGLTVTRGGRAVVEEVDLQVPRGTVTALLGTNGAGKTSLIGAVAGVLPSTGTVRLGDRDLSRERPVRRARAGLATVEQGRTVFGQMSTLDNLRIAGGSPEAVEAVLGTFPELRPKLSTRAGLLSGGEQQMLMLARALTRDPAVLLVDEMSLGLAPGVVRRLLPLLRRLAAERDMAVLLVEQFAVLALAVCEHAYVLRRGRLTHDGPAAELAADPGRLDAAYFGSRAHGAEH